MDFYKRKQLCLRAIEKMVEADATMDEIKKMALLDYGMSEKFVDTHIRWVKKGEGLEST